MNGLAPAAGVLGQRVLLSTFLRELDSLDGKQAENQALRPGKMSEQPSVDPTLSVEELHRIDEVCVKFDRGWRAGRAPRIETVLTETHGAKRSRLLYELLLVELDYRAASGRPAAREEYLQRFADDAHVVHDAFGRHESPDDKAGQVQLTLPRWFGNYQLLEVLGEGGMGVVYRAQQYSGRQEIRQVALKAIRPDRLGLVADHHEVVRRFVDEARHAASLEHTNIVPVYEVGEIDGQPFFSMKLVKGQSLAEALRDGPLDGKHAAKLLVRVADAVHFANQRNIVHRDLKPGNILLDAEGIPYVADFGLAKWLGAEQLTQSGIAVGTPPYMSPEQARGDSSIDHRSDIYSLGASLYESITGRAPFRAASVAETLRQVIEDEPISPRQLNPAIDRDLETICLKCLEKDPQNRYPHAKDVADELQRYIRNLPILTRPISRLERSVRWCRRNRWAAAALAMIVAVAVVAPLVALSQHHLASRNAVLVGQRDQLIDELNGTNEDLKSSYDTVKKQKEEIRHVLLNADLKRIEDAMAIPNVGLARRLLRRHIPRPGDYDFRSFPWFYWWRECHREERSISIDSQGKLAVLSTDGGLLATVDEHHQLLAVDLESYELFRPTAWHGIETIAFDSASQIYTLSSVTTDGLTLDRSTQVLTWGIQREAGNGRLDVNRHIVLDARALLPKDNSLKVKSFQNHGLVAFFPNAQVGDVVATSPDVDLIATTANTKSHVRDRQQNLVAIWDGKSGQLLETLKLRSLAPDVSTFAKLAFSRDGRILALGDGYGTIQVWRRSSDGQFQEWARFREFDGRDFHSNRVTSLSISSDRDTLAVAGLSGRVALFDLARKSAICQVREADGKSVTSLAFLPENILAAGSEDTTITFWKLYGKSSAQIAMYKGHESAVTWIGYSSQRDAFFSTGRDHTLKRWRLPDKQPPSVFGGGVAISSEFRIVSSISVETRLERNQAGVRVVLRKQRLQLIDVNTGKKQGMPFGEYELGRKGVINSVQILPSGHVLAVYDSAKSVDVWDAADHRLEFQYNTKPERITRIAADSNAELIAIATHNKVLLLRSKVWKVIGSVPIKYAVAVSFTPGGELLVVNSSNEFSRWTASTEPKQNEGFSLSAGEHQRWWLSPECRFAVSASEDGRVQLWDLLSRSVVQTFLGHNNGVHSIAFSPDDITLATGSYDGTIKLWDRINGEMKLDFPSKVAKVLGFSPNGRILATTVAPIGPTRELPGPPRIRLWYAHDGQVSTITPASRKK